MICVVGVVFISVLGLSWADYWPGDAEFQTICRTIIDDVFFNQIRRRGRGSSTTADQGCQSGAMALKTAPVKIYWRQGLLSQRQTTLQQEIMNCLTALSGHAANARCSTVAPQRRHMHHTAKYARIYTAVDCLRMRSARNCFGAAFSAPAKINFDTPADTKSWSTRR